MATYLKFNADGSLGEVTPGSTSAGAGDAGKLLVLDAQGRFDIGAMPTGIGADTQTMVASEAIADGDFVNIYNNAGAKNCRKAIATDNTKPANGFVLAGVASLGSATVFVRGINSHVALGTFVAVNVGSKAFLSPTVAGGAQTAVPTTTNQIAQTLGTIDNVGATVSINFSETPFIVRA